MAYNQLEIDGRVYDFNAYPVGSIYISTNSTSPASIFGGTWERLTDRFLIGGGGSYSVGSTGGASSITLTKEQLPAHTHRILAELQSENVFNNAKTTGGTQNVVSVQTNTAYGTAVIPENNSGRFVATDVGTALETRGQAHNNMPPYLAVYMWKRTA